jgi:hypothetical protein
MTDRHAANQNEVGSVNTITADIAGGRQLIVTSGIVLRDWVIRDGNMQTESLQVFLNVTARNLEQVSAFVGLASIANEDTEFTFATDSAVVTIEPNTGELILHVNTALLGDSALNRISYQVVATVVSIDSSITGSITWSPSLYVPNPQQASTVAPEIPIFADKYELIPGTAGSLTIVGADQERLTPQTQGEIESFDFDGKTCVARYRIVNPPKAMPLKVVVTPSTAFGGGAKVQANRISGPEVLTLTLSQPDVQVDFEIVQSDIIK